MRHSTLLIILAATVLVGCTPVGYAKARRIDAETWRANSKTSRINELHDLNMKRENALTPVRVEAKANIIWIGQWTVIFVIIALAWAFSWWVNGSVRANVKRQEFRATLIPLDPTTRQFPLLPYVAGGKMRVYNPNTNSVICLDKSKEIDLHLADNQTRVQMTGLAAGDAKLLLNGSGED